MSSSDGSRPATPALTADDFGGRASVASRRFTPAPPSIADDHAMDSIEEPPPPAQEQTTLLHDEEESFALAPVDASALKGNTLILNKIFYFLNQERFLTVLSLIFSQEFAD